MSAQFAGRRPPPSLVPTGTARERFLGAAASDSDEALPRDLRQLLSAHDVADETLLAAWEVTLWTAGTAGLGRTTGATAATLAERRALVCLVVALLEAMNAGSTLLPIDGARAREPDHRLSIALGRLGLGDGDRTATAALCARLLDGTAPPPIAALFGTPGARRPFILANGALQSERLWSIESRLITTLRARLARTAVAFAPTARAPGTAPGAAAQSVDDALASASATPGATPLVDEQLAAVRGALANPLTVVAGGPGAGKTSIVVALLRVLARLGVTADRVALAAPTGRAAQRMQESVTTALGQLKDPAPADVDLQARFAGAATLHRLLGVGTPRVRGLGPDAPQFHSGWRLPHQVVIVDEASMIDLTLMDQLASAVSDDARLILIGDADQLPSVALGAVFRDLCAGAPRITYRLRRSHRMSPADPAGAEILRLATSVNTGTAVLTDDSVRARAADVRFVGLERVATRELGGFLDRWHREILTAGPTLAEALDHPIAIEDTRLSSTSAEGDARAVKALLACHASARILCVTRTAGRATSTEAVNRVLHGHVQEAAIARGAGGWLGSAPFIPGEPVLMLRNDHVRGLHNGDPGVVVRVRDRRGEDLGVAFEQPTGIVVHSLDELGGDVALAFALTVHKAQGSEYGTVALVLPEVDVPLLSREILYTALTRARHSVVIIGDPALFALAATRTLDRASALALALAP